MEKIAIVIADDHQLLRAAWTELLNSDNRFDVIGSTGDPNEAVNMAASLQPRVMLLDVMMNPIDGFEVTRRICNGSNHPYIIGISMHSSFTYASRMMQAGANGYITKNSGKDEFILGILEVSLGHQFLCEDIRTQLCNQQFNNEPKANIVKLTSREMEVVQLLKEGLSSKEIGKRLNLSGKTVEVHRFNILRKLKTRNTAALINLVNKQGL